MLVIPHLTEVVSRYDLFLLDLWGVVHDGSHLYDGVLDTLEMLRAQEKKVIFISNAPRRSLKVKAVLTGLGVGEELYFDAVSSGEVGYQYLKNSSPFEGEQMSTSLKGAGRIVGGDSEESSHSTTPYPNPPPQGGREFGRRYFYIGPSKDADILDGLDYKRADDVKAADFLLNVGFGSEEQTTDDFSMLLRGAKALGLPMLCLNPDLEVVKISGERFPCAGVIGKYYEQLGGEVAWFGKPYAAIYDYCLAGAKVEKNRILAIGDSLETDIPGGQNYGVDTLLITGGILKHKSTARVSEMCLQLGLRPTYTSGLLAEILG